MTGLFSCEQRQLRQGDLAVRLLRSSAELTAIRPQWDELLADSGANTIALTPAWLEAWWEKFGAGRELCVLAVSGDGGRLVGLAPLLRRTVRHRGMLPLRRLEFLASGEDEADEIDSDYLDFILRTGHEQVALDRIFRYLLMEMPLPWDEIVLHAMPERSPTPRFCQDHAPQYGLSLFQARQQPGVIVHLPASWDEYLARFSSKSRYNLRRERRLLEQLGPVSFQWTRTRDQFHSLWPALVDLHQSRWREAGAPGCFSSPRFTRFHERLGHELADQGKARIAALSIDNRPVAVRYQFVHNGVVYDYQSGQDPNVNGQFSPGNVLVGYCIEAAIAEGLRTYDFLRGVRGYKQTWSKDVHYRSGMRLGRPGLRETLRGWMERGATWVKRWRAAPRPASGPELAGA